MRSEIVAIVPLRSAIFAGQARPDAGNRGATRPADLHPEISEMSVDPMTIEGALARPSARVQPGQHQNRSDPHEADAVEQPGSCHSAQGEAEPGHQQAHQGQEVHS